MGMVSVEIGGSFKEAGRFSACAEEGGHALALQRAISFLNDRLPSAIRQDHRLHDEGTRPPGNDFGWQPSDAKPG